MMKAFSPNGTEITGTLDRVTAVAGVSGFTRDATGAVTIQHSGDTEIDYDSQATVKRGGQMVFLDDDGNQWLENQLVYEDEKPEEDDDEEDGAKGSPATGSASSVAEGRVSA